MVIQSLYRKNWGSYCYSFQKWQQKNASHWPVNRNEQVTSPSVGNLNSYTILCPRLEPSVVWVQDSSLYFSQHLCFPPKKKNRLGVGYSEKGENSPPVVYKTLANNILGSSLWRASGEFWQHLYVKTGQSLYIKEGEQGEFTSENPEHL